MNKVLRPQHMAWAKADRPSPPDVSPRWTWGTPDFVKPRRRAEGAAFAIERAPQPEPIGEIRWVRARLLPKPAPRRIGLETRIELPETLAVFLLWIAVQYDFRNAD